jgi:hypothetical protein
MTQSVNSTLTDHSQGSGYLLIAAPEASCAVALDQSIQNLAPELLPPSAADGATVRPFNEVLKPARMKVVIGKCS